MLYWQASKQTIHKKRQQALNNSINIDVTHNEHSKVIIVVEDKTKRALVSMYGQTEILSMLRKVISCGNNLSLL